jgi:hypothetical protein
MRTLQMRQNNNRAALSCFSGGPCEPRPSGAALGRRHEVLRYRETTAAPGGGAGSSAPVCRIWAARRWLKSLVRGVGPTALIRHRAPRGRDSAGCFSGRWQFDSKHFANLRKSSEVLAIIKRPARGRGPAQSHPEDHRPRSFCERRERRGPKPVVKQAGAGGPRRR